RDDAGIYKISEELALVQTIDFFTPIVDNPYDFGQIAVANALSDIYAMGGTPKTGLNMVGFPTETISKKVVAEILRGGYDKASEACVTILGGHTVKDPELKFGMAVTGFINPGRILHNSGALPGDVLILTKPLGTGILTTALKNEKLPDDLLTNVTTIMKKLNGNASEMMQEYDTHACTDITGYGFLGHLYELVAASGVSAEIAAGDVPLLPGAVEFSKEKQIPGGLKENMRYLTENLDVESSVSADLLNILFDPQTSGGLLISLPEYHAGELLSDLKGNGYHQSRIVGKIVGKSEKDIIIHG
ncbi:MAG: selenide, water dikinase SelD, partial [Calditrichia bacterium]